MKRQTLRGIAVAGALLILTCACGQHPRRTPSTPESLNPATAEALSPAGRPDSSTRERLNEEEARKLAVELANGEVGGRVFRVDDVSAPTLVADRWVWSGLMGYGLGDIAVNVSFSVDGTDPRVSKTRVYSIW